MDRAAHRTWWRDRYRSNSKPRPKSAPRLGADRIPATSTAMCRSASRRMIWSSARRVTAGSSPRSMSFAPSSRMTASVPSGTDQSRRARPPVAVSPETPAFATSTVSPLALSAFSSFTGKAASAGRPYPAVSESPSATIFTVRSAAPAGAGVNQAANATISATIWTNTIELPYDRGPDGAGRATRTDGPTACMTPRPWLRRSRSPV